MTFAECVCWLVARIPAGRVMTYGDVALALGAPRAARMVGGALHYAPDAAALPWQRVINRAGGISPRNCEHSIHVQAALLRDDGVEVREEEAMYYVDLPRYRWWPEAALLEELERLAAPSRVAEYSTEQLGARPTRAPRRRSGRGSRGT